MTLIAIIDALPMVKQAANTILAFLFGGVVLIIFIYFLSRVRLRRRPISQGGVSQIPPHDNSTCELRAFQHVPLLTPAERSFLGVLEHAVGRDHRVLAKVRLADIVR